LIVIPVVVEVKEADPARELAPPELFKGMLKVAVSPGSRLPLLFPVGSLIVIFPKARAGAAKVLVKLYSQVLVPEVVVILKFACSWSKILLATVKLKALFFTKVPPAAIAARVSVPSVIVIPAVEQVKVAVAELEAT